MSTALLPKAEETIWLDFDGREIGLELATLTPERAQDLLDNYNNRNRKISNSEVLKIARDMSDGLWLFTGEPIIIGEDGNMQDGQHRCQGVIDSGISVPVLIVYNISTQAMAAIDQGKNRTVVDILKTSGPTAGEDLPNDTVIGATARLLMMGNRSLYRHTDNRQRVALYVQGHANVLIEAAGWAKTIHQAAPALETRPAGNVRERKSIAPAPVAALTLIMQELGGHRDDVRDFFEKIVGKTRADNDIEHHSYTTIRNHLVRNTPLNRATGGKMTELMTVFETMITQFNRVHTGVPVRRIVTPTDAVRWFDELPKVDHRRTHKLI